MSEVEGCFGREICHFDLIKGSGGQIIESAGWRASRSASSGGRAEAAERGKVGGKVSRPSFKLKLIVYNCSQSLR